MQPLSYQLYSSRNFPPLGATLKMLADIGYAQVEGYGALYADASTLDDMAEGLRATGLAMPTGHFSLEMARDETARVLTIAEVLGVTRKWLRDDRNIARRVPFVRLSARVVRYDVNDLFAAIEKFKQGGATQ